MPNYEAIRCGLTVATVALSIIASGCGWRAAMLRDRASSTAAVDAAPLAVDASSGAASPAASPAPVVQASQAPRSSPSGDLQELEQLLLVTEAQHDQNQQPLRDSQGLVIHRTTPGWRREDLQVVGGPVAEPVEAPDERAQLDRATAALRSPHAPERHAALVDLAELSRQSPPGEDVLRAVTLATSRENEAVNWLLLLEIAANSESEMAPEVAYAALHQTVPEVKIAACRLLADRPSPGHVPHLLPNLDVRTPAVTSAALEALGGCGPVEDTIPLELLLACPNHELRVDAAAALARLGVRSGSDALERLLLHRDPKVNVRAVGAIARLEDPLFLAALMDLLDRKIDFSVRRAVLAALPVITAHDITAADGPGGEPLEVENFIAGSIQWQEQRWRDWYYSGGRS